MTEKIHRIKTKEADAVSGYLLEKLKGSTYITLVELDSSDDTGKNVRIEVDASALEEGISTGKVKISIDDSTFNYIYNKVTAGAGLRVEVNNPGGNENIVIVDDGKVKTDVADTHGYLEDKLAGGTFLTISSATGTITLNVDSETTFTGLATKLPSSSAIKTLLQALTITDAVNCGSSGDPIMYEKEDIRVGQIMIIESDNAAINFVDSYPDPADLIRLAPTYRTSGDRLSAGFDRLAFGDINIGSVEDTATPSIDVFAAALIQFTLNENYISGDTIYLDVMLKLADSTASDWETKLNAHPYYVKDADTVRTAGAVVHKTIQWNEGGNDVYEWHTFSIAGFAANTKPSTMSVFLTCLSEDGAYTAAYTGVNNATICAARVRYKKKTLELPIASVISGGLLDPV